MFNGWRGHQLIAAEETDQLLTRASFRKDAPSRPDDEPYDDDRTSANRAAARTTQPPPTTRGVREGLFLFPFPPIPIKPFPFPLPS